jgi:phospholipid transport system substrate-binding protein
LALYLSPRAEYVAGGVVDDMRFRAALARSNPLSSLERIMRTWVLAVLTLLLPGLAFAAKDPAQVRAEAFIAGLKRVKPLKSPADRAANEKVFTELDGFIDFDSLTVEAIKPRADKFNADQKAEYMKKFRELVRLIAYPDSGDFFKEAQVTFKPVEAKGAVTNVPFNARMAKEDLETDVTLHWVGKGEAAKLIDVSFDGESLVKDYQNQFTRIIDKDGVPGLIKKLDERRGELAKQMGEAAATGGSEKAAPKGKK